MASMRIMIIGASGRMGQTLIRAIAAHSDLALAGAVEAKANAHLGQDAGLLAGIGALGIKIQDDALEIFPRSDAVIDFSAPQASVQFAALSAQARLVHVIGTTGFSENEEAALKAAARHATIVRAGNFSLGVNLLAHLARQVAATLDDSFDIEIVEMHHRAKVDAPSGTGLLLGNAVAEGRGKSLKDITASPREGRRSARKRGDIGFASLRGGTVVGDHSVIFAGEKERIELTHRAEDREIFAHGALKAARWAYNNGKLRGPGLFSMADVLGLSSGNSTNKPA